MHDQIERAARQHLVRVLDSGAAPESLDPDVDLADGYGLTSLNKVLYLTSLCEDVGIALSHFTEQDVARMRTLREVTGALSRHAGSGAAR
ncbi:MAG: acyl carrier protein [Micromonosporaceae bacterium]